MVDFFDLSFVLYKSIRESSRSITPISMLCVCTALQHGISILVFDALSHLFTVLVGPSDSKQVRNVTDLKSNHLITPMAALPSTHYFSSWKPLPWPFNCLCGNKLLPGNRFDRTTSKQHIPRCDNS